MTLVPRYTKIVEAIKTDFGTLIREDYHGYPLLESNIYLLDTRKNVVWFAQQLMEGDCYPNPIILVGPNKIKCFTAKGVECEIELNTGRVLNAELVR